MMPEPRTLLKTALRLETATIAWMVIEAAVAIGAGIVARSLLLIAFGVDSGIELVSAIVVLRYLQFEFNENRDGDSHRVHQLERKTARVAGCLLLLLSAYVVVQAVLGLLTRHAAEASLLGMAVAVVAALGMPLLAKLKLRLADEVGSPALRADAMETLTCGYLSWVLLAGLALNAMTHWWWIDSLASLAIVPLLFREGFEALSGQPCC